MRSSTIGAASSGSRSLTHDSTLVPSGAASTTNDGVVVGERTVHHRVREPPGVVIDVDDPLVDDHAVGEGDDAGVVVDQPAVGEHGANTWWALPTSRRAAHTVSASVSTGMRLLMEAIPSS